MPDHFYCGTAVREAELAQPRDIPAYNKYVLTRHRHTVLTAEIKPTNHPLTVPTYQPTLPVVSKMAPSETREALKTRQFDVWQWEPNEEQSKNINSQHQCYCQCQRMCGSWMALLVAHSATL